MAEITLLRDDGEQFVVGDDAEILVTPLSNVPSGQILTKAWFTLKVKRSDADPGVLQKVITDIDSPGNGHITDTGAGDTVGELRFDLPRAETASLTPDRTYYWDIQAKTDGDKLVTIRRGRVVFARPITVASS
jgi:hypothetical protein